VSILDQLKAIKRYCGPQAATPHGLIGVAPSTYWGWANGKCLPNRGGMDKIQKAYNKVCSYNTGTVPSSSSEKPARALNTDRVIVEPFSEKSKKHKKSKKKNKNKGKKDYQSIVVMIDQEEIELEGWSMEIAKRANQFDYSRADKYYYDPNGKQYRSIAEIQRSLLDHPGNPWNASPVKKKKKHKKKKNKDKKKKKKKKKKDRDRDKNNSTEKHSKRRRRTTPETLTCPTCNQEFQHPSDLRFHNCEPTNVPFRVNTLQQQSPLQYQNNRISQNDTFQDTATFHKCEYCNFNYCFANLYDFNRF
jgi:hypothetical protein